MFLSDLSIKRPIMMSMFLIVFLLFGGMAYVDMSLDLMPNVDIPYITVQTVYEGAGPREIETQITKKIEDAVSSISKIETITSYSMEGVSFVILEFEMNKDVNVANQEVKDKVDRILNDLPDDSDDPIIEKVNLQEFPIVEVVLSGDMSATELYELADKQLKDRFSQIEGVARADISGGQEREIQVVLADRTVFQNSISIQQLASILASQNLEMPGGHFSNRSQEYTVRLKGEYGSLETLAEQEIPTATGNKRLKDIATIVDVGSEVRERTAFFDNINKTGNDNVVLLSIVKNSEGNTVDIADAVRDILPTMEKTLPEGVSLEVVTDKSTFIRSTVNDTVTNILLGILLTGLVLFLFLHDFRSTIIVALAMPMSILSAFMVMGYVDFTKNMMTLMGLSTAVGILVSNSVVVLENIFRHKEEGMNRREAASVGTSQVVVAVIASTATNIAVFLPVANMSSIIGQFFRPFALTVTIATMFSLLISFTLTPMMASLVLPEKQGKKSGFSKYVESNFARIEALYRRLLEYVLGRKKTSVLVLVSAVVLFFGTMMFAGRVGFEFAPMMDEGDIQINVELPLGYNLEETAAFLQRIETRLAKDSTVKHVLTQIGQISDMDQGTNLATIGVKLISPELRTLSTEETASKMIADLSDVPNASIRVSAISSMGRGGEDPIVFYLKGQDVDELESIKEKYLDAIKDVPGLVNLNTSSRSGKPEMSIIPDRKKISDAGLTVYEIAMQLRGALNGMVATQYRESGEEYDLRILVDDAALDTPEEIGNLKIFKGDRSYSLSQLGQVSFDEGVSKILHIQKYKAIQFSAHNAAGYALGDVTNDITARLDQIDLPPGYNIQWGGNVKMMNEAIADIAMALIIALILTYMLLSAILENLTQPLMVLGTFPLALIGVYGAMIATGSTMNIVSMMSIVMLLGIVVNNAILILDHANVEMRQNGKGLIEALLIACPLKLRPILMSTIAIILGMVPMAMGIGDAGREMRQPMGIVTIGGLVVSTALTLVVIPALLNVTSRKHRKTEPVGISAGDSK